MIPVGTKVMIMSEKYPKYNGEISTVMKALQKGDSYKCRVSEVNFKTVEPEGYFLQDVFETFHPKENCDVEVCWLRSSLRVIDDKPCGQSFEEVMRSVSTKTGIVDTGSVNMTIKVWSEQIDKEES